MEVARIVGASRHSRLETEIDRLKNDCTWSRLAFQSFDRAFCLAPCEVDFSVDFGVVSLEKMELGTRFKTVFCGGDFCRRDGNLSIYCFDVVLKVVETQRILVIISCGASVSESSD